MKKKDPGLQCELKDGVFARLIPEIFTSAVRILWKRSTALLNIREKTLQLKKKNASWGDVSKLTSLRYLRGQSGYPGPLQELHFVLPRPATWDCRKAGLILTLWQETTRPAPAGVPRPTSRQWDRSPTPCGKPPPGSPQRLQQLLLSPVTTCRHVAFCTSGCCLPVPAEGAAPSLHPAVIATAQGFRQAGCWRLWLRAQPPPAAPRPQQATASVPRRAYEPVATAEEVRGDLHVSSETSLPQGAALVGLETQTVTWPLPLADRRCLPPPHHMRGHFSIMF